MGEEVFIDANLFLEILLGDKKADICESFLKTLQEKSQLVVTTDFVVYSCLIIIHRNLRSIESVRNAFIFFANYTNLHILRPSFDDIYDGIKIMDEYNLDFDDSLIIACMKINNIEQLASMDKHFDRVKWIKRIKL